MVLYVAYLDLSPGTMQRIKNLIPREISQRMNPFLNPIFTARCLKELVQDEYRIIKWNHRKLEAYQSRKLREVIKYAFKVPVYRRKFEGNGFKADDITSVRDIKKIPIMTRDELRRGYPDDIVPYDFDKRKGKVVTTGGSTGKPLCLYVDWYGIMKSYGTFFAMLRANGFNWRDLKIANIGNFNPYRADQEYAFGVYSAIKFLPLAKKVKLLRIESHPLELLRELDDFKPDCILTYGGILLSLAHWMRKGYGKNVKPKLLATSGAMLDKYTRSYVEDTFGCRIVDIYSCVETGCGIAFQCKEGNYHVHSDFVVVEALDDNYNQVAPGERGKACITKLYGGGTPIVRYVGLDDWIVLSDDRCNCGIQTKIIDRIEGRVSMDIVLPGGRVYPSGAFTLVADVLHELKTFKIKRFQVVQKRIDKLEILLVVDEDLRNTEPPLELIFEKVREAYQRKVGEDVEVEVKEVKEIKDDPKTGKPAPLVVSLVNRDKVMV